jgi:ATP-dependent DNA ligase
LFRTSPVAAQPEEPDAGVVLLDHLIPLRHARPTSYAAGRWGQGLTAGKMEECVWVRPEVIAQIEFLEWTGADHLRHTKFVGLREDKDPLKVVRET